jgi:hypothetical protein
MKEHLIIQYTAEMEHMEEEDKNLFNTLIGDRKAKNKEKKQKLKMETQANRNVIYNSL